MIWPYIITVLIALIVGFILGSYFGAKFGIRVFAKDAIILAFRTIEANPEKFVQTKDEALRYPEHEVWIQRAIDGKADETPAQRRARFKDETIAEINAINERTAE